jgi:LysM repeat protein
MYTIYQIEYGDTLDKIASKTNTTVDNIKDINGFMSNADLMVGNLMVVPKNNGTFKTYTVKQGDSIYSIARMFNVDPDVLLMVNGLNKTDYIYPNQEVLVPINGVEVYVTKSGDTLDYIIKNLGIDANRLNNQNKIIYVMEDQLIINKKEEN